MVPLNIPAAPWVPPAIAFEVPVVVRWSSVCAKARSSCYSISVCTESCTHHYSVIHSAQPKHSLLSVKRLQRCRQTALGGRIGWWGLGGVGGGRVRVGERERETFALLWETTFLSSPRRRAAEHPDFKSLGSWIFMLVAFYHVWAGAGFVETGESVWSIDHCYCCPCLLCVSQCSLILREKKKREKKDTERGLRLRGARMQPGEADLSQDHRTVFFFFMCQL